MTEKSEQEMFEEMIRAEIDRMRKADPKYAAMSDCELRGLARKNIAVDRQTLIKKLEKNSRDADVCTVGCLYGKTHEQILEEQKENVQRQCSTVGNLYGKTRDQILKEQEEET